MEIPDSTVDNDGDESTSPVCVAPKLFLKALPGGNFTSSSSSHVVSSSPAGLKRTLPPPHLSKPKLLKAGTSTSTTVSADGESIGVSITRIIPPKVNNLDEDANDATPAYLPNIRFLTGNRNFLTQRKSLPGLTPITQSSPTLQLQVKAGSTGTSLTISKSPPVTSLTISKSPPLASVTISKTPSVPSMTISKIPPVVAPPSFQTASPMINKPPVTTPVNMQPIPKTSLRMQIKSGQTKLERKAIVKASVQDAVKSIFPTAHSEPLTPQTPDGFEIKVEPPKTRGRPRGSGRGRGRPRGSTMKAKLEREREQSLLEQPENNGEVKKEPSVERQQKNDDSDQSSDDDDSLKFDSSTNSSPVKPPRGRGRGRGSGISRGSYTPRGARRGGRGSRGGRGARGAARKILLAKRRADAIEAAASFVSSTSDSVPEIFEEETRMSADIKPSSPEKQLSTTDQSTSILNLPDDDVSNVSSTSASINTVKTKKFTKDFVEERKPVTAETLFEYQWPPNNPDSEFYFLQEQIIEFLGHKSFRRKFPNLRRRCVEMLERDFLRENKVVSETQCDLGLTAVNSSEVLDILYTDFPDKYEEYRKIEVERKEKELTRTQATVNNNNNTSVRDRSAEFIRRITKSCASWNATFNHERKENRSCCFDLQTCTINMPMGSMKVLPPERTKLGYHPVSVIQGQFTDGYKQYTPLELKYLPLNTVMYGPIQENKIDDDSEESGDSESDASSTSDDSSSSSSEEEESDDEETLDDMNDMISIEEKDTQGICKTCNSDYYKNKDGRPELLIKCAKCDCANHPTCLELSLDMVPYIKKYEWQCTDCKNCIECNDPADEDKMLFCDCCDRGYHIYCVGLRKVPNGRWHCLTCSVCYSCGTNEPSVEDRAAEWHYEYKKGDKGSRFFLHSLCVSCHKIYKKGQYCPICLKCHLKLDDKNLLECRSCEKWVHKQCVKKPLNSKFGFVCDLCDNASFTARTKLPPGRRN